MRKIAVLDTTLRDGEQAPGCSMKLDAKLQIAAELERLRVDYIEAGFPVASPDDFEAVKAISKQVKDCGVAAMCRAATGDITCAWEALRHAQQPRIHLVLAVSDLHLEHKLRISREAVLEKAVYAVRFAKKHCADVQYSPEDCSRADRAFLMQVINAVVDAGVTLVNLTDTVGYLMPGEAAELVRYVKEHLHKEVPVGIHCHNDLGLAVANTLAGIEAGADHVECTIGGIGERAGNASLAEVVMALRTRPEYYGCTTGINTKELYHANKLLYHLIDAEIPANKPIVGDNAFAHESGIHQHGVLSNPLTYEIMTPEEVGRHPVSLVLGKHSGKTALGQRLEELGYRLDEAALKKVTQAFKELADRKKGITDRDIEELVRGQIGAQATFSLHSFVVNSGTLISPTAVVKLKRGNKFYEQVERGESAVIAAFKAVDRIVRHSYPLKHFTIQSVSEGRTALSEIVVHIMDGERIMIGRGMDTDIVAASIKAYLAAINKILLMSAQNDRYSQRT